MDINGDTSNEKKSLNKVRSLNTPHLLRLNSEPAKRKSSNVNEAVRSLDLALGRLKKSKLVNWDCRSNTGTQETSEMFMDMCNNSQHLSQGIDNASLMSMNFSHYELMRNLSRSNCNSEGAFSGNTGSVTNADIHLKDEHLERYFRSIEMWSKNYKDGGPSNIHFEMPNK